METIKGLMTDRKFIIQFLLFIRFVELVSLLLTRARRKQAREEMECKCLEGACEEHRLEELLRYMDEAIIKAKEIMDGGSPDTSFTREEIVIYYSVVYTIYFKWSEDQKHQLCEKFKGVLEESIKSVVLPSLADVGHVSFLTKLLEHWSNYTKMTELLLPFFDFLDIVHLDRSVTSAHKIALNLFSTLVCDALWMKLRDAVIHLMNLERRGYLIDRGLLMGVILDFFMYMDKWSGTNYNDELEQVILTDTLARYSRLALNWLSRDKFSTYIRKVRLCLKEEKNAEYYLLETTMVKLLEDLRSLLLDESPIDYIAELVEREVKDGTGSNI